MGVGIRGPAGESVGGPALQEQLDAARVAVLGIEPRRLGVGSGNRPRIEHSRKQRRPRQQIPILAIVEFQPQPGAIVQPLLHRRIVMGGPLRQQPAGRKP